MENSARSRRKGAGVNESLSADYDWPERFGRGIGEMENPRINESHITIEKEKTSEKSKLSKSAVSLKSHTSARVLQKKLNYETEKTRQEIEMEKAKLENQLRLLQLEHDLQEEEIRSVEEERQSQKLGLEDVQSSLSRVQEWVNNSEENGSIRNRSNSQPGCKVNLEEMKILQVSHLMILSNQVRIEVMRSISVGSIRQMEASIGLFSTWLADMANAACCVYTSKEPKKFEESWKNVKKPTFQRKQKWPETVLSTNTEEIKTLFLLSRSKSSKNQSCRYCENEQHRTSNCPKMKLDDVNTRWEIIKVYETDTVTCYIRMFSNTLKNVPLLYTRTQQVIRYASSSETLEPVKMVYTTYESTTSDTNKEASPLMIMHGLFGSKSNWNSLCKAYNQKLIPPRKLIALDARNHGDSPHNENHTYEHLAADIKASLDQLNIHKSALMGHSMGGRAVMLFALRYSVLVEKLVVADISPVRISPNFYSTFSLFEAMKTVNLPSDMSMSKARALVEEQLAEYVSNKPLRAFLLTNLIKKDDGSYDWRMNIPVLSKNFGEFAKFPSVNGLQYDGPVLFLAGSESDFVQMVVVAAAEY
ncbi:hypothetical protein JTB14_037051 [Gonioctena quinquepunctata]|nr:hypothetical protein JTB14_037051 [Gonioctena quinquepunctata]